MNQLTLSQSAKIIGLRYQVLWYYVSRGDLKATKIDSGARRRGYFKIDPLVLAEFIKKYEAGAFDNRRLGNNRRKESANNAA